MADAPKTSGRRCGACAIVQVLCFLLSTAAANEITDKVEFQEKSYSTFTPFFDKLVSTSFGSRRETSSRPRLEPSSAISTSHSDYQRPWKTTAPSMSFNAPDASFLSAVARLPESKDVRQQLESGIEASTAGGDTRKTSQRLPEVVGQSEVDSRSVVTVEQAASAMEPFQTRTDAVPVSSDAFGINFHQNREKKPFDDSDDHVTDYDGGENEDYEDDDSEEEEFYNSDEDEGDDYYDEDYPYDGEYENGRFRDPIEYKDNEYRESVDDGGGHQYFREGNLRLPVNYTDGMLYKEYGLEYEHDYQIHLPQNHPPDPGNREIRRLVIGGKSSQIDVSLLVIYAWLGLVAVMIAIAAVVFKYKQQLSAPCLKLTSNCRKVRQVIGIEEGNNLLGHPLV